MLHNHFANNKPEFKRAFTTSNLSFSHDTGRVVIRVKDLNELKDSSGQLSPAEFLRDVSYRSVLKKIRSDEVLMWSRNLQGGNTPTHLLSRYSVIPKDAWDYTFGKFLEDLFYGKAMEIAGRVVSVHVKPLEPVDHVSLQTALWQDHIDH
ncbi:hypothetical protein PsorP6_006833 [Peronosclerospora sorghi]|uniref:Uncharacterized protein n=1 Tax=Peronosclerospora sorghi TaxID=230839 RepID=A0ACC0W987_9STRA|nr:hypothetical protein PsorP6_006833 [Peronosclerospora sorghi]